MSVSPVSMGPLSAGLGGIHRASDLLAQSAGQVLDASVGRPSDLEGAVVGQIQADHALSASLAVIKAGDERLEELISLFTG